MLRLVRFTVPSLVCSLQVPLTLALVLRVRTSIASTTFVATITTFGNWNMAE